MARLKLNEISGLIKKGEFLIKGAVLWIGGQGSSDGKMF